MLASLWGSTLVGLDSLAVQVEIDISPGLPGFHVVGLPDAAVSESADRVRTALRNAGFLLPARRITVNLAPGDLRKEGPRFDLAIALGLLVVGGVVPAPALEKTLVLGELALDGGLRPIRGVLAAMLQARRQGLHRVILPQGNVAEAVLVSGPEVMGVSSLSQAIAVLNGAATDLATPPLLAVAAPEETEDGDLSTVFDQPLARRALEIAAAGNHHLLLVGPPGCGKTHLARCLPSILPPLREDEALEVLLVRSVSARELPLHKTRRPPFQEPDLGVTWAGLFGGNGPGEVSRAHRGVLFLDELPEYRRTCIEGLRTVLDTGRIEIVRAQKRLTYPASFLLIAAMNPCPCGFLGDKRRPCRCLQSQRRNYLNKLSGPLLDRIDLQVILGRPEASLLLGLRGNQPESSARVRERVLAARERQAARGALNSQLQGRALEEACALGDDGRKTLARAGSRFLLSGRSLQRALRIARTIADLAGEDGVLQVHLHEALGFRLPALHELAA